MTTTLTMMTTFRTINSKAAAKKQPLFCAQKACAQVCPMLKYQRAQKIKKLIVQASAPRNVNDICAGLCRAVNINYAAADIRIGVHMGLVGRANRVVIVSAISRAALVGSQ